MKKFVTSHPLLIYFIIAYVISYGGFLLLNGERLVRHQMIPQLDALILFPIMVVGVAFAGIILTGTIEGKKGINVLFARIGKWHIDKKWYLVLLIPPVFISVILFILGMLLSPVFTPKFSLFGLGFGIVAGFFEEIGWTGFAVPKMIVRYGTLPASILLGVLWGLWHAPIVDDLGAAFPHGEYWLPFFLSFVLMLVALRILLVWIYSHTKSILLAQLLHASNTGFLVVLSPIHVSAAQETLWYAIYAVILWIVALSLVKIISYHPYGSQSDNLRKQ